MFEIGQTIAHFEILQKLGEGGMGEVYLVRDTKLNRNAAMKVLHKDHFEDKERRERFVREAQMAAQINHPNVMAIFDIGETTYGESGEFSYIVMEYLAGQSLSSVMREKKHDLAEMVRIAEKISFGLASAHKLNIVHRDIKADNIIIEDNGEPKILDFGLAKAAQIEFEDGDKSTDTVSQELTKMGKILGTVSYMSPEQARGEKVDTRSDIFSFGVLLYRMVTGELPFDGPTQVSTLAKILESQPAPPSVKNENIHPELERIINKCLQKDPSDRYQGASDLAVDLRRVRREYDSGVTDSVSSISQITGKPFGVTKGKMGKSGKFVRFGIGTVAVAVLVIVALSYFGFGIFSGEGGAAVQADANSLAILGFENKTGDTNFDWLTTGLPEILLTDLSQSQSLNVISRERILDCFADKKSEHSHEECVRAAKTLGAGKMLSGSFYRLGDQIRIDARLEDVTSGNIILAEKVVGPDAFTLVDSLTMKLASSMDISNLEGDSKVSLYTSSSEEAYKHYLAGMEKFGEQDYEQARESFNNAIGIDSTFAMPYLRIGMSYVFQGQTQRGLPYFQKAKSLENRLPQRDRNLLDVYADVWLNKEFDDAFTKLDVFVKNHPNDKEGRAIYAMLIYQFQHDTARAFAQIDSALQVAPLFLLALNFKADINRMSGNVEEAIKIGKQVKEYYPNAPVSYDNLASAYKDEGNFKAATIEYQEMYKKFPGQTWVIREIGRLQLINQNFDSSIFYFNKYRDAVKGEPYDLRLYHENMANLSIWKGNFQGAIKNLLSAVEQAKKTSDSDIVRWDYELTSRYFERMGFEDSALYYAKKTQPWASGFNKIQYPFILLGLEHDKRDEARKLFKPGLSQFRARIPSDLAPLADGLENLFDAMYQADTLAIIAALGEIHKAQGSNSGSQNEWEMGTLSVLVGDYKTGIEILKSYIDGKDVSTSGYINLLSHYYLGMAYEGQGDKKEAIEHYTEMLKYWGNADIQTKEIKDAKERLAKLTA